MEGSGCRPSPSSITCAIDGARFSLSTRFGISLNDYCEFTSCDRPMLCNCPRLSFGVRAGHAGVISLVPMTD